MSKPRVLTSMLISAALFGLASCATAAAAPERPAPVVVAPRTRPSFVKHKVEPGETAFSIAKKYSVSVDALSRANHIQDAARLFVGRVLEIPIAAEDDRAEEARPKAEETPRSRTTEKREGPVRTPTTADDPADEDHLQAIEEEVRPPRPKVPEGCEGKRPAPKRASEKFIWPAEGVVVSSFGQRDGVPHEGIDVAAPIGAPIWASKDGTVLYSGEQPGYGLIVILRHDGDAVTIYAHNAKNCVPEGARVAQGEVIALVGDSGTATSPSVHFELRLGSKTVNPRGHLTE